MERKVTVALIFGGRSAEHEVSLTSAAAIFRNLDKEKFRILSLFIEKTGRWRPVESPLLPPEALNQGPSYSFLPWEKDASGDSLEADIYFPVLHGPFGEDGTIQGLFEVADVPYVGAAVLASAAGMDKAVAKTLFTAHGLPVADYLVLKEVDWRREPKPILQRLHARFALPFYVKPANLGSSVGITKVKDPSQAHAALERAFGYDQKILIEEGIPGRELECSVLGNEEPKASLPGEITPCREFYDYLDKYHEGKTKFGIPAALPSEITSRIQALAVQAFRAVDCEGMARVDFFLRENSEELILNEINTIPGFTQISMYPKLWEISGISFPRLLEELIDLGMQRHRSRKRNLEWA
jgi:D-alanine-D-alanine ligase